VTANPVWVTQLVEMGFPREKAIRALQQVKNSSLDAAMNAMFSLPDAVAGDTPSSSITTSTAAPSQSNKAQSKLLAQHPDTKQAEPVTEAATATPNANAVEESLAELDPEAQAIFAKLQREKAAKSKARAAKPDGPPKKKTSEMTSEEKMEWLAQRREQVAKDKIKQKFQTVKEREMSRRNTAKAANTLRRKREEMEMEALKRARMKEKAEKKAAKKRIKERIAMEKERRKKEAARERARLDALKAAKAQQ
jgi:hypothetical protein